MRLARPSHAPKRDSFQRDYEITRRYLDGETIPSLADGYHKSDRQIERIVAAFGPGGPKHAAYQWQQTLRLAGDTSELLALLARNRSDTK